MITYFLVPALDMSDIVKLHPQEVSATYWELHNICTDMDMLGPKHVFLISLLYYDRRCCMLRLELFPSRFVPDVWKWGKPAEKDFQPQVCHFSTCGPNFEFLRWESTEILLLPFPTEAVTARATVHGRGVHWGICVPALWGNHGNQDQGMHWCGHSIERVMNWCLSTCR